MNMDIPNLSTRKELFADLMVQAGEATRIVSHDVEENLYDAIKAFANKYGLNFREAVSLIYNTEYNN